MCKVAGGGALGGGWPGQRSALRTQRGVGYRSRLPAACSSTAGGRMEETQSDRCVGSSPMELILYTAKATPRPWMAQ